MKFSWGPFGGLPSEWYVVGVSEVEVGSSPVMELPFEALAGHSKIIGAVRVPVAGDI